MGSEARAPLVGSARASPAVGPAAAPTRVAESRSFEVAAGVNELAPGHWQSHIEDVIPTEYQQRSWAVDDALQGRSFSGSVAAAGPPPQETQRDEHLVDPRELARRFATSLTAGHSRTAARALLQRNGPNQLTPPPRTPTWMKFMSQLVSGFAPILWVAALLCFLAWRPIGALDGNTPDPLNLTLSFVLVAVIFLQAIFNFYQEYKSDCVMERLTAMLPSDALVLRDGVNVRVPVSELVVGDMVSIEGGEKVPADVRIVTAKDLRVDTSTLNGESEPVRCTDHYTDTNYMQTRNMVFFGCNVTAGTGTGIVVATGDRTVFGDIARLAAVQKTEASTLHKEIRHFVLIIVALSLSTGAIAFIGWLAWLRVQYPAFLSLSAQVVNCISLIVAFVPEGMPVAVTVALAIIAKDMAKNQVLVKNLGTVETLGAVSMICSDKTGTLTENRMSVSELSQTGGAAYEELVRSMVLCNRARQSPEDRSAILGDATETGLLRHYLSLPQADPEALRAQWPKVAEVPFNSMTKYMLSIHRAPAGGTGYTLLMKGAPEKMLEMCSLHLSASGKEAAMSERARAAILEGIRETASRGHRVIGFCRKHLEEQQGFGPDFQFNVDEPNFSKEDMVFIGWAALRDPPRVGVREAIAKCRAAHVSVAMVTGDMPATAEAIARQVGILSVTEADSAASLMDLVPRGDGKAIVLTGSELDHLDGAAWDRLCAYPEAVFARTTPKQKLQIVQAYQAHGRCVAVTGDGVNDAPALKQADCGVAMGSGSAVSKEAADLIILDDNFANVVKGIEHGRRCFANLKKVIIYLLPAGSWSEMLPVMTNVFLGMPLALSSFLMIVICCLTDVSPSIAMVYEKPEAVIMTVPPRVIGKDRLVDWRLLLNAYAFIGMIEGGVAFATFFVYYYEKTGKGPGEVLFKFENAGTDDVAYHGQCLYFYALLVMQFGNVLTSRTSRVPIWRQNPFCGPARNPRIFLAMAVSGLLALVTMYTPFIQTGLNTRGFDAGWLPLALPWFGAMLLVGLNESRKVWIERFPHGLMARCAWG